MKTKNPTSPKSCILAIAILVQTMAPAQAHASAVLDEARAALQANDLNRASALLEPLTLDTAQDAVAFHLLSTVRLRSNDAEGAIKLAEKATKLDATKAEYFSQLGMALGTRMSQVGFMQQAMMAGKLKQAFSKAVELDPNDVAGLIGLVRFYGNAPEIAGGSPTKARELAGRVQRIDPFLGAIELAGVAEQAGDSEEALAQFEAAAALKPGNAHLEYQCGRLLAKLGRKDEARVRLEAALKIDPDFDAVKKSIAELDDPAK